MASDRQANFKLTATDEASPVLGKVKNAFSGLGDKLKETAAVGGEFGAFGDIVGKLGPLAALAAPFAIVAANVHNVVESLSELKNASAAVGTSAQSLSEFRAAALTAGVGADQLNAGLTKLNVLSTSAASGNKEAANVFNSLGVSFKNAAGGVRSTDDVLADVADKFASYRDGASKTALAVQLFGKAGAALVPYLDQGSAGIRAQTAVTNDLAEKSEKLANQWEAMKLKGENLRIELAGPFIDALTRMNSEFDKLNAKGDLSLWDKIKASLGSRSAGGSDATVSQIADVDAEVSHLQATIKRFQANPDDLVGKAAIPALKEQIAQLERTRLALDTVRQARGLLTKDEADAANEEKRNLNRQDSDKADAPIVKTLDPAGQNAIDAAIKSLKDQLQKDQELTEAEKVLADIRLGQYKGSTAASQAYLLSLAKQIDSAKQLQGLVDEGEDINKNAAERKKRFEDETKADHDRVLSLDAIGKATSDYDSSVKFLNEQLTEFSVTQGTAGVSTEQFNRAMQEAQKTLSDKLNPAIKETSDEYDEFLKSAAKNIQTLLADKIENGFKGGLKGMLTSLGDFLRQATAQLVAADLSKYLFGDQVASGKAGSQIGGLAGSAGGYLSDLFHGYTTGGDSGTSFDVPLDGAAAVGGSFGANKVVQVDERGPETFNQNGKSYLLTGSGGGSVVPNNKAFGGGGVNVTFNGLKETPSTKNSAGQVSAMVLGAVTRGQRYA